MLNAPEKIDPKKNIAKLPNNIIGIKYLIKVYFFKLFLNLNISIVPIITHKSKTKCIGPKNVKLELLSYPK